MELAKKEEAKEVCPLSKKPVGREKLRGPFVKPREAKYEDMDFPPSSCTSMSSSTVSSSQAPGSPSLLSDYFEF